MLRKSDDFVAAGPDVDGEPYGPVRGAYLEMPLTGGSFFDGMESLKDQNNKPTVAKLMAAGYSIGFKLKFFQCLS